MNQSVQIVQIESAGHFNSFNSFISDLLRCWRRFRIKLLLNDLEFIYILRIQVCTFWKWGEAGLNTIHSTNLNICILNIEHEMILHLKKDGEVIFYQGLFDIILQLLRISQIRICKFRVRQIRTSLGKFPPHCGSSMILWDSSRDSIRQARTRIQNGARALV